MSSEKKDELKQDSSEQKQQQQKQQQQKVDYLKVGIQHFVKGTNHILGSAEDTVTSVQSSFASRLGPLLHRASYHTQKAIQQGLIVYEQRQIYGTEIVAASTVTTGLLYGLRRGRFSGVFMGALAGSGAYVAVYGIEVFKP
eukprot:CAMPEP_0184861140 /NCGR_PEP_ID=MMETSP0580-20130426/5904_1 /TAXON_ID=1118495 /ORGANISM="Dactyliosolen fragilissimus" /LENGTH=140 /DNA_ID=CAMNT_0027358533 /DNA_START=103 /DNA_END=525 /DNA_ORIENTATION=-